MRVLLVTPPMVQPNTPYPATAYLTGFLRQHATRLGVDVRQADASLELFLRVFSQAGLTRTLEKLEARGAAPDTTGIPDSVAHLLGESARFLATIDPVVRHLQGRDPSLALRIVGRDWLPEGSRFASLDEHLAGDHDEPLAWAFGSLGLADRAKHLATLYLDDIADAIRDGIDPSFGLSRYAGHLVESEPSFAPLAEALEAPPTLIDTLLDEVTDELAKGHRPDLVGFTVPFPGNVYGAFRMARRIKQALPEAITVLGGGYVNTELRQLAEPRVFDYFDYVTLDDGEQPLLLLLERIATCERDARAPWLRTLLRRNGEVVYKHDAGQVDVPLAEIGTPTYDGLPLDRYVSMIEMLNPMHRLWSDGRWNKLTVAHGCYWKKCSFCDVTLDYIGRYDPLAADALVDRIETLVDETGQTGFHFVDEAAPPAALQALAERLLDRGVVISWWGNVRFEEAFGSELTDLLARSGCVAISGGLEVASDRLLALMEKGVTVEQVARVTRAFTDAGIMVHAYLMYGFPSQTEQDTVDALERVRQLFEAGCLQSAYWHRFIATAHSPVALNPSRFGITLDPQSTATFARNVVPFTDPTGTDNDRLGRGLTSALYNYMHGLGLTEDVRAWFDSNVPPATVPTDLIQRALDTSLTRPQ